MRRLHEYRFGLAWLVSQNNPGLNSLVSQVLNRPESVWKQWLMGETRLPRVMRGKLSFLLTQAVWVPGVRRSTGVDLHIAWRHYCQVYRQRFPEPVVIGTRIARSTRKDGHYDSLTEALIWYWMLEMGYSVALPYYLCHQMILLGLHVVRAHVTLDELTTQLHCDNDMLERMLGGFAVVSPIGACRVMTLNDELAAAHPLTERNEPDPIPVESKTA